MTRTGGRSTNPIRCPCGGGVRHCAVRRGSSSAFAVVRRGRHHLGGHPVGVPALGTDPLHRRVHGLYYLRNGVLVPLLQLPGDRRCRRRDRRARPAVQQPDGIRLCGSTFRDPPQDHVGRYRGPFLLVVDAGGCVADGSGRARPPPRPDRTMGVIRCAAGGFDGAEHLRGAAGSPARRRRGDARQPPGPSQVGGQHHGRGVGRHPLHLVGPGTVRLGREAALHHGATRPVRQGGNRILRCPADRADNGFSPAPDWIAPRRIRYPKAWGFHSSSAGSSTSPR